MGLGLLLVAVGAIVRFAVTKKVTGINLKAVGVILMIIGALARRVGPERCTTGSPMVQLPL